jgi:DNA-binding response OmpR family regulator
MDNRIFLYGNDQTLLMTRRLILEKQGYRVFTAMKFGEAIQLTMTHRLDVLILCQSLSVDERNGVLATVREIAPSLKTLILGHGESVYPIRAQVESAEVLIHPKTLLGVIDRMLGATL